LIRVVHHRPKFVTPEWLAILARDVPLEQHRAAARQANRERNEKQERRQQNEQRCRRDNIEDTLEELLNAKGQGWLFPAWRDLGQRLNDEVGDLIIACL